jgi:hypothetical protein
MCSAAAALSSATVTLRCAAASCAADAAVSLLVVEVVVAIAAASLRARTVPCTWCVVQASSETHARSNELLEQGCRKVSAGKCNRVTSHAV